jgi:hypothetical protein
MWRSLTCKSHVQNLLHCLFMIFLKFINIKNSKTLTGSGPTPCINRCHFPDKVALGPPFMFWLLAFVVLLYPCAVVIFRCPPEGLITT